MTDKQTITPEEAFKQIVNYIEEHTVWESYGYYGPLVYTGGLLNKIYSSANECGIKLELKLASKDTWDGDEPK